MKVLHLFTGINVVFNVVYAFICWFAFEPWCKYVLFPEETWTEEPILNYLRFGCAPSWNCIFRVDYGLYPPKGPRIEKLFNLPNIYLVVLDDF